MLCREELERTKQKENDPLNKVSQSLNDVSVYLTIQHIVFKLYFYIIVTEYILSGL